MAESEEKLLKDYFQKIDAEAEEILDVKLDTAIRKGMQQGNRSRLSFRKKYAVVVLVVLAFALLIIVPWANQMINPVRAQLPPKSWGQLEVFRPVIANNLTIKSALDAGMMKEVNISSPEVDGITWTVNGIIADRRGIAVLYTIQNNTDQKMQFMGLSLKKAPEDKFSMSGYSGVSNSVSEEDGSPGTTYMFQQIVWDKYQDELLEKLNVTLSVFPATIEHIIMNSDIKKLSVTIPMDTDKDYFEGEFVDLKDSLAVSGQKIKVNNVYMGPTGIYMQESYDGDNKMKIFRTLSPKLIMGKGKDQETLNGLGSVSLTNGGPQTNIYHNDNMRPDDPIKLEIEGISALDKSKVELVINTETQQILKAPDSYLTISKRTADEKKGIILLDLLIPKKVEELHEATGFGIDDNFVDSAGSGHWLVHDSEGYSRYREYREDAKGTTITYFLNVGKEKLPQPLTFKFNDYPNLIMEKVSMRIR